MKHIELVTKSAEETKKIGKKIAQKITSGGVVCLYGNLGSGKTTFTQGLAEELGIKTRVNSPTFIIMRSYEFQTPVLFDRPEGVENYQRKLLDSAALHSKNKERMLYHLDLYRIESERDVEGLGIGEILEDPSNIVVIEWPEKLGDLLPEKRADIHFTYLSDTERKLEIHEN